MKTVMLTKIDEQLQEEWHLLWSRSSYANYINSPHWFLSVIESFGYKDYLVIALYEESKLVAIAGLIKEKRYGVTVYTLPPGDFVCGLPFLIDINNKNLITTFSEILIKMGTVLLDNVPEEVIKSMDIHRSKILAAPYTINYILDFKKNEAGQVMLVNRKKLMHEVRRIEDKLVLKRFHGASKEALQIAFQIDKQSRKQTRGYNTFSASAIQNFYKSLAIRLKENFCIHILYLDGVPISYDMGFLVGSTYYGSQIAFNEEYRRFSPGKTMEVKLIESLAASGVKREDFGSGDNHIKRLITDDYRQLYKVVISKNVFTRKYLKTVYQERDFLFNILKEYPKVYAGYRHMKKTLKIKL